MRKVFAACAAVFAAVLAGTPANAGRTVIDSSGQLNLSGYCDTNGEDCVPIDLGYNVDFGSGNLNKILIYGDGKITFGPTVANFSDYMGNYGNYGVPVVSAGINPGEGPDSFGDISLYQSAELTLGPAGAITARYYYCQGPANCVDNYIMTLTRQATGYDVNITYLTLPVVKINGYAIPGVTNQNFYDLPTNFFIPATFSTAAVPEPTTWGLMLLGFGMIGASLRRPRRILALG